MIHDLDLAIGRRLRHRRRVLNMTQAQVAELLGVRFQQIAKYECASNRLSLARFLQFCETLQTTPTQVLEGLIDQEEKPCDS